MKSSLEPNLIECIPVFETDTNEVERTTRVECFCQKHGTFIREKTFRSGEVLNDWFRGESDLLEAWKCRKCRPHRTTSEILSAPLDESWMKDRGKCECAFPFEGERAIAHAPHIVHCLRCGGWLEEREFAEKGVRLNPHPLYGRTNAA